jgi:hypothetical protein
LRSRTTIIDYSINMIQASDGRMNELYWCEHDPD